MLFRKIFNPISTGGGDGIHYQRGFSNITKKREKVFLSNLLNFFIKKWMTICIIELEGKPLHVAMAIKGVQKLHF